MSERLQFWNVMLPILFLEVEDLVYHLINLLQQVSLTHDSFFELEEIIRRLEGQPVPQALGSACVVNRTDFWRCWNEYEEACSHREAMVQFMQSLQQSPLLETTAIRDRLSTER